MLIPTLYSLLPPGHASCHDQCLASVDIRRLRDARRLKAWLRAGKRVDLRERVIARIVPAGGPREPVEWPDFPARRKQLLGNRIVLGAARVIEERGRY